MTLGADLVLFMDVLDLVIRSWASQALGFTRGPWWPPLVGGCGLRLGTLLLLDIECKPHLAPGGSGVLANPARLDEELSKGLASLLLTLLGKGRSALRNSLRKLIAGCPWFGSLGLPELTGSDAW